SLRCELHGIGKQVEKNLFDLPLVTYELPKALVDRDIESDAVLRGPFPHKGACVIYCQGKVELSQFKLHTASLNLRKIQDLIDKGEQMATGGKDVLRVLSLFLV